MRAAGARAALERAQLSPGADERWRQRAGRLFAEFERPATAMVRRAFRGAFSAEELEDIYASAWVGTLRALAGRHEQLSDEEVRSYVLTAVANQANKELRRRRRKPTASLELVDDVPDTNVAPDERAALSEQSRLTRDLLVSLPPRRRAVMLLRYGWGLDPQQVCALVEGLSPRAYRKEITRGVDELTAKMRAVERGEWCADREAILKTYAAGLASADETRQAKAHLAHCRDCSEFVARLAGHLHDLGGAVATAATIDRIDGPVALGDRLVELAERSRDATTGLLTRAGSAPAEATSQLAPAGGARGAGAVGAGVLAKLAGLGTAGKLAVACVSGGVAATACVAAGVAPIGFGGEPDRPAKEPAAHSTPQKDRTEADAPPPLETLPSQVGNQEPPPNPSAPQTSAEPVPRRDGEGEQEAGGSSAPAPAEEAPASDFSFGAQSATAAPPAPAPSPPPSSSGGDAGGGGSSPEGGDFAFGSG